MVLPLPQLPPSPPAWRQKKGELGTLLRANVAENTRYVVFAPTRPVFARDAKRLEWNVEHIARRRPAKARGDGPLPAKLREFDKKLEKLSTIVATLPPSPAAPLSLPSVTTLPSQLPTLETSQQTTTPLPALSQPMSIPSIPRSSALSAPSPQSENSSPFWDSMNDTVSCLGRLDPVIRSITLVHMQALVDTYHSMVDFFPFVLLPREGRCQDLFQHRPMLTFAVLTVSSYDSVVLQQTLSQDFRKVVMAKIIKGEKSLDLLQGLLVFIAWHHHYMDTQAVSITMLLQLCLGIASDLGLDTLSRTVRSPMLKDDTWDREAKRAYLGCYYLSSNIDLMQPGKARSMSHTSTLRTYASELAASWENKSDAVLPIMMDVCQYMEDVEETFRNQLEQAVVVRTQVKRLSEKWESIQLAVKLRANDSTTLHWLQLAARIQLYRKAATVEFADRDNTPWASGFQLSLRVTLVRSVEQFLDNTTKLSSTHFEFVSLIDWLNLVNTLTNLSKLVLHASPMPGWDPTELQITRTFDHFRDLLSSQMPHHHGVQDNSEDAFERFRRITSAMRMALHDARGMSSPNGTTFELATGSGRTVSLLHNLALPKINGGALSGSEKLPSLRDMNPAVDITCDDFHWKFLMGTV
ncbi:hypothetical protein P3342_007852 [Pyrenophora teres f. teres]|nr:hypothetical protein P3342_007852 [Pyrenophora teres f. teres]